MSERTTFPVGVWQGAATHDGQADPFELSFHHDGTVALRTPVSEGDGRWSSGEGGAFTYTLVERMFDQAHETVVGIEVIARLNSEEYSGTGKAVITVNGTVAAQTSSFFKARRVSNQPRVWHNTVVGEGYLRPGVHATVQRLREAGVSGPVHLPGDQEFEDRRRGWNLTLDNKPALVVVPRDPAEVAAALAVADDWGWPVAVIATGHGPSVPMDRALLLDMSALDSVTAGEDFVTVGPGVRWSEALPAIVDKGNFALSGSSGDVGVAGYLSGGGLPVLNRSHGLAADSVAELVVATPYGELVTCGPDQETELFRATLGGRGNFGVIVSATLSTPRFAGLVGGNITYAEAHVDEAIRAYFHWCEGNPSEMNSSIVILRFPDLPQTPPEKRNRYFVQIRIAFSGSVDDADLLLKPLREIAIEADTVGPMDYQDIGKIYMDPPRPTPAWIETRVLESFPREAVESMISVAGQDANLPFGGVEVRHLGGRLTDRESISSASHAGGGFQLFVTNPAFPDREEEVFTAQRQILQRLSPWLSETSLPGFLFSKDQGVDRVKRAYSTSRWEQLAAVKRKYDPRNTLRINHNIPPSTYLNQK